MNAVAEKFAREHKEAIEYVRIRSLMEELEHIAVALVNKNMGSLMFWLRFFLIDLRDETCDSPWRRMLDTMQDYGYMKEAL